MFTINQIMNLGRSKIFILFVLLAIFLQSDANAKQTPGFGDFKTKKIYSGKVASPDIKSHPEAKMYKTRLLNAAKGKVNFAGKYIFAAWGCGASCKMAAIINAKTGKVYILPFTVCCWKKDEEPFDYKINSKLLIVRGMRSEKPPQHTFYYKWEDGKLENLQTN